MTRQTRQYGPRSLEVSNLDKPLFPDGTTKGDLIDYYERVAPAMLPHLKRRPLTLQRFPDGIEEAGFYQKQLPSHAPHWIERVEVATADGSQTQMVCDGVAALAWLAQEACITPHVWLSTKRKLEKPDRLVIDLDPPDEAFGAVRDAARWWRDLLEDLGLVPFCQTTGSRGAHVVVPLDASEDFDDVRGFARDTAAFLAAGHPDVLTTEQRKAKRKGRLYLDVGRNAYGQTAVAPYAVRARPGAPVATPMTWEELGEKRTDARRWTISSVPRRLGQRDDPWKGIGRRARGLGTARERLARMRDDEA